MEKNLGERLLEQQKELSTSEIYDKLRQAHELLKDVYYSENYTERYDHRQRDAVELVSAALYVAEGFFTDF